MGAIRLLTAALAVASFSMAAFGQTGRVYRIGFLATGDFDPESATGAFAQGILRVLGQQGYVVGKNLMVEQRGAEAHKDRLPSLATELVNSKVDVIATNAYPSAAAAKQTTTTVPIVISGGGDPVRTHLIMSLSHPGGNITGVSDVAVQLAPKRLAYLKEAVPSIKRVAMLWNADDPGMTLRYQATADVANQLGITVQPLGVREPDDFNGVFEAMDRAPPDAILMVSDSLTVLNRKRVFDYAGQHRIPALYEYEVMAHLGGLMSYGPDMKESVQRASDLVARIFKGARPSDLPFEQPTRYPFVVNLKTAKATGIELPVNLVALADEVIE